MVFSSFEFLACFLPLFLAAYYLSPGRLRNLCLFAFSMGFYAWGARKTPAYAALLLASIAVNWAAGVMIGRSEKPPAKKAWLAAGLAADFGALVFFKYSYFLRILPFKLILPIGISFYTFQSASYLIDVYRGDAAAERDFVRLGTYISMFPQLIAGPIVRYTEVSSQLRERTYSLQGFVSGLKLFVLGLGSKVVLANQLGTLWTDVKTAGAASVTVPMAWLGILGYSLQLYLDFYGYSLMAAGLGRMAGFELPRNFDSPYVSVSMTEFWRRWHITLGAWFREYVYIPLGGSRRSPARNTLNLLAVWLLTGFWHGADWNFIVWGLFLFASMLIERLFLRELLDRYRLIGHLYMLVMIPASWLIFASGSLPEALEYAGRLIGIGGPALYRADWKEALSRSWELIAAGIFCSTEIPERLYRRYGESPAAYALLSAVLAASIYCLYRGLNDPFLYFRF